MHIEKGRLIKIDETDIQNGQVIIPEGVTSIEKLAFFDCIKLTSIVIPNGVSTIEEGTFFMCHNLTHCHSKYRSFN